MCSPPSVLLLLQTTLIAMRRRAVRRRLGVAGAVIAAVIVFFASIAVAGPALGPFSLNMAGTPFPGVIAIMLLPLLVVVHDRVLMKRVHPVSAWGAAAIIGSLVLNIAIANNPAGPAIVRWLE